MNKHPASTLKAAVIKGGVATDQKHDSAHKHVTGEAVYIDDIPEPEGTLHVGVGLATVAHANIKSVDLAAVRAAPGVVDVLTYKDIPGENDVSPSGMHDDPILAADRVQFHGQPIFAVIARTRDQARRAARLAKVEYEEMPGVFSIAGLDGAKDRLVFTPLTLNRGDARKAIDDAPRKVKGRMMVGGQDHFYLEGQASLAVPGEDEDVTIYCSTQGPSETQHLVAHALGVPSHAVTVEVRRMGGGFGGKETQANQWAAIAAIAAKKHKRAVKIRLDRDEDMTATGKRHDFMIDYEVGFDDEGNILGVDYMFALNAGFSADLSGPVGDRALFHCDNAYFFPAVHAQSAPLYTNTVSNTAFRGFGGPQGMVGAERVIEEVAFAVGKDPLDIRKLNFYDAMGTEGAKRNITPYHQKVEDCIIQRIVAELEESADYAARREAIRAFNAKSRTVKRGMALTPVKFGISFTKTESNQAGALVHVYNDGSVHMNHGGTEMGQGLHMKVAQVVAEEFQIDIDRVKITATTTAKVPNTAPTAASSGADLNGMAAQDAARQIKKRLIRFAAEQYRVPEDQVVFLPNRIRVGNQEISFNELVKQAYIGRVQLSAAGHYKTPKIHWDRAKGKGHAFYYYAYGAACSEVSVDTLTGEYVVERTDILHDTGRSLNRVIDIGQVEGGFVQGMGWLTTEELVWDDKGRLRTHAPSTYKIPLASDRPKIFNVALTDWSEAYEPTIHRSKAVGEPPLPHGMSVLYALSDAVASVADHKISPRLDAPATPERVLMAIERLRAQRHSAMPGRRDDIRAFLNRRPDSVLVEVADVKGSAPRDAGAWMLVARDMIFRTIGGGQLEYLAIDHARKILAGEPDSPMDVPLGPEIGQCCGGRVGLSFRRVDHGLADELIGKVDAEIATRPHVYVFGAGHVGDALAYALSLTPVRVVLVDTRENELMAVDAPGVETCLAAMPEQVVRAAPPGSAFIILTHDHALDFLIAAEALQRRDAAYVGMIGSKTKKATFKNWLKREIGSDDLFDELICPVGGAAVKDKRPEVIAALAAAEVLTAVLTFSQRCKMLDKADRTRCI